MTALPSTDPVTTDGAKFCSDVVTYFDNLLPSFGGLDCANAIEAERSAGAGGIANPAECKSEYEQCLSMVESAISDSSAVKSATASIFSDCTTSIAMCKGVTVAEVSNCVSDLGDAILRVSNSVTEDAVCSAKGASFQFPDAPASCKALPSDCLFSGSSSSFSSGSSGGGASKSGG